MENRSRKQSVQEDEESEDRVRSGRSAKRRDSRLDHFDQGPPKHRFKRGLKLHKNFRNFGQGEKISVEVMENLMNAACSKNEQRKDFLKHIIKEMHERGMLQEKEILKSFKMYDSDGSGSISREEIQKIVKLAGEDMNESEIEEMIRESDVDGDGEIDFKEFVDMILR